MVALPRPMSPAPRILWRVPGMRHLAVGSALLALVAGAAFQVNQYSRATSTSYEIDRLTRERAALQAKNHDIEKEVAGLSSLAWIEWSARTRLHMKPAAQRLYLTVNQAAPARQTLPTRFLPAADRSAPELPTVTLWRRMLKLLPFF